MSYYRHIVYAASAANVFVLLGAGFGLDDFCRRPRGYRLPFLGLALALLAGAGLYLSPSAAALRNWALETASVAGLGGTSFFWIRIGACLVGLAVLFWAGAGSWRRGPPPGRTSSLPLTTAVLLSAWCLDLTLFRVLVMAHAPRGSPAQRGPFVARPLVFVPERSDAELGILPPRQPSAQYSQQYQFENLVPYEPRFRSELASRGREELLRRRGHASVPKGVRDLPLQRVLGRYHPKLKVFRTALSAGNREEAARLVSATPNLDEVLIVRGDRANRVTAKPTACEPGRESRIEVIHFSANELVAHVRTFGRVPEWLFYSDAFHPGWSATVNGKEAPILEADLAFKAVRLEAGDNLVRLRFGTFWGRCLAYLLALEEAAFFFLVLWAGPVIFFDYLSGPVEVTFS
jgi:hypothetical protein